MIDLQKNIIVGKSGKVYKIIPDQISVARWAQYEIQAATLGFNTSYQAMFDSYKYIYTQLKGAITGEGILNTMNECKKWMQHIDEHPVTSAPKAIEFCAIFCICEGEDVGSYSDDMVASKFEDWKHIPMKDFFLLYHQLIPGLKENYQKMQNGASQEDLLNQTDTNT